MYLSAWVKENWQSDPRRFVVLCIALITAVVVLFIITSLLVSPSPKILLATEAQVATKPVVVKFALPPSRQNIEISVSPETPVTYQWSGGFFGRLSRTLLITPESSWDVSTTYSVAITNIQGAAGSGRTSQAALQFSTQDLPDIATINVSGAKDVLTTEPIEVVLTEPAENLAEFIFTLSPAADFTAELAGSTYLLRFNEPLQQGQKYKLTTQRQLLIYDSGTDEVIRRLKPEKVSQVAFTTKAPALVKSFSPQGTSVLPIQKNIEVVFNENMDQQSVLERLSIAPAPPGSWGWVNGRTLRYSINGQLPIDTNYRITIKSGAKARSGSFIEEAETLSFKTVGSLRVISARPANGSTAADLGSNIEITFDQPVVTSSISGKISLSPATDFSYRWSGNTLIIDPKGALGYYRNYSATVSSGLKSQYGKLLPSDYVLSFTTELKRVMLNIPMDYQDRALSCEAAALKMALRYRGVSVTESDIMAIVGYDPTIKSGNIWGDPDVAFVGNIDGSQNSTGYGVHWGPIANAAKTWRSAKAFSNWSAKQLATEIEKGNPVVIWGVLGNAYYDPWKTSSGRTIAAWKGEHARTVIGFSGSVSNPVSFTINDPVVGRITWPTGTLIANWGTFNNSGVVVY